jgi:assimilatory nitrate reductase catalytic subunit
MMQAPGQHWITQTKHTTCPYCGVGCGLKMQCDTKLRVQQSGEITEHNVNLSELEGDAEHPANFGNLCVKGSHLLDTNDSDDRLLYPHVDGKRASWEDTLAQMSEHIKSCIAQHGPDSIAFYLSGQLLTEDYYIANKLMKGFLGTANVDTNSRLCMSSAVAAYKRSFGADAVPCCYEDLDETELLILIGSNAAWTHPVLFQRMQKALAENPQRKLVVIDPRATATSKTADLHLAIKPGTDAWVYNGLLHYLIENKLCDNAFIEKHTLHFDDISETLSQYTIEEVAIATQVDTDKLNQFYNMFACAPSAISFYSMGINQSSSGTHKANSIINCHLATGKIGKAGSGPFSITGQPNAMGGREVGGLANMLAAHMDIENNQHNSIVEQFWQAPNMAKVNGLKAVDMFDEMAKGKIKFIWIMGTNPVVSMPNRKKIEAALSRCDMVVVSDIVKRTDTLSYANITLPSSGWSEKDGTVTNSERRISRQRGIMPLLGEAKHDWQIVRDLACTLGFESAFNYQNAGDIFDEHARLSGFKNQQSTNDDKELLAWRDFDISGLAGLTKEGYDALKPIQWPVNARYPAGRKRLFEDGQFYTKTGKANFINVHAKLPEQLATTQYPFILNTGRMRDQWHTMTRTGKAQALTEHTEQATIYVHPSDAKKLALKDNSLIALHSEVNKDEPVIAPVTVSEDVKPGVLFAPIHWSKTNSSHMNLASLFTSANDPISGQPELKHAAVSITNVKPKSSIVLAIKKSHANEKAQFAEYQVRINQGDFWLYYLSELEASSGGNNQASNKPKEPIQNRLFDAINDNIIYLSSPSASNDTNVSVSSKLALQDGQLVAYFIETSQSEVQSLLNPTFIRECFEQSVLTPTQQSHLLSATVPSEYQQGKLICSCFNVRQTTIENAISTGVNSVQKLGEKLGCGTNCGSCKSELSSLIKSSASQAKIPIKTLECAPQQHSVSLATNGVH